MRKLTRMAAIGGVGLLALTACGDDEPEQEETPNGEQEEVAGGGYESAEDLDALDAQAFVSNNVISLNAGEYGPVDVLDERFQLDPLGAECEEGAEGSYDCIVLGPGNNSAEQQVNITFEDADADSVNVYVEAGEVTGVYAAHPNEYDLAGGVFLNDNHLGGEFEFDEVPLEDFEARSPNHQ